MMGSEDVRALFGVTEEQLDAWEEDASKGVFRGEPGKTVMGRPRITDEPLRSVTVMLPASMVDSIDSRTSNRSEFIRRAIAEYL